MEGRLLRHLIEKQSKLKASDEVFASQLGISRQLWNFTRHGKQPIHWSVLIGTLRAFPELRDEVFSYLLLNANVLAC